MFNFAGEYVTKCVYPIMQNHLADTPEAMCAAGLYGGRAEAIAKPCWTCDIPGSELNSLKKWPQRDFTALHNKLKNWLLMMSSPSTTERDKALSESKKESMVLLKVTDS